MNKKNIMAVPKVCFCIVAGYRETSEYGNRYIIWLYSKDREKYGVQTPTHDMIVELIKGIEDICCGG